MASTLEFTQFVCEALSGAGEITCKRMFGEYGLYCNGTFFGTVEDNMLCLKITDPGRQLLPNAEIIEPHEGAHYIYIEDLDNRELLAEVVIATCKALLDNRQIKAKNKRPKIWHKQPLPGPHES